MTEPLAYTVNWQRPVNWQHPLNRGLVSWWLAVPNRIGWGSFTWRDLCRRNDGALTNLVPSSDWRGAFGRCGGSGAVFVDGADGYVLVPDSVNLRYTTTNPKTVSVWFRSVDTTGTQSIISKWGASTKREWLLYLATANLTLGVNGEASEISTTISAGVWYHALFTLDTGGTSILYLNGVSVGTGSAITFRSDPTEDVFIGWNPPGTNFFEGFEDDIRIWNRVLSPAEAGQVYYLSKRGYPGMLNRIPLPRYAPAAAPPAGGTRYIIGSGLGGSGQLVCAPEYGG